MTQEKIEQLAEQICSEFVTDKDTTATFGVDFDRKDIVNALIAMADEVIENIIKELPTDAEVEEQIDGLIPYGYCLPTVTKRIKSKEERKVYFKARKVILSCQNIDQLNTAMRYVHLALKNERNGSEDYYDGLKAGIKWAFNWLKNNI